MKKHKRIEKRIAELKWRALTVGEKFTMSKSQLLRNRFQIQDREAELVKNIRIFNLAAVLFVAGLIYLHSGAGNYSPQLSWLFICSFLAVILVRMEMGYRKMCLDEIKFLKGIQKNRVRSYDLTVNTGTGRLLGETDAVSA